MNSEHTSSCESNSINICQPALAQNSLMCNCEKSTSVDSDCCGPSGGCHPDSKPQLPPPPEEPLSSDCCGQGCQICVYDIYEQELKLWKEKCDEILCGKSQKSGSPQMSPDEYKRFELVDIKQQTHDTSVFTFKLPDSGTLGSTVGQHLVLRWQKDGAGSIVRQYTPVSDPNMRGFFEVLIKIYDDGRMSQNVKNWEVGHFVEWRGPFGHFLYKPNTYKNVVMLAAGTGIAPMVQVTRIILDNENDETRVHLLYACKSYSDILMKDQLNDWTGYWNFSVLYALSQDSPNPSVPRRYGDKIHYGHINAKLLESELKFDLNKTLILVCGTSSFEKDMINHIKSIGCKEESYFKF